MCGTLNSFFDRNGEFKEEVKTAEGQTIKKTITFSDDKTKIIGKITQGETETKKLLLNLNETELLIDLLTELKDNKVNLFLATRCQPEKHINHPFLTKKQILTSLTRSKKHYIQT